MHVIAAKAVAMRIAQSENFRARQRQTIANAKVLAEELQAGGIEVLTGGTDVHLVLVDVTSVGLGRPDGRRQARRGGDHREPQRDPVRRAAADEPVRASG
jgi:glycine hydroxymethyltransferase